MALSHKHVVCLCPCVLLCSSRVFIASIISMEMPYLLLVSWRMNAECHAPHGHCWQAFALVHTCFSLLRAAPCSHAVCRLCARPWHGMEFELLSCLPRSMAAATVPPCCRAWALCWNVCRSPAHLHHITHFRPQTVTHILLVQLSEPSYALASPGDVGHS